MNLPGLILAFKPLIVIIYIVKTVKLLISFFIVGVIGVDIVFVIVGITVVTAARTARIPGAGLPEAVFIFFSAFSFAAFSSASCSSCRISSAAVILAMFRRGSEMGSANFT